MVRVGRPYVVAKLNLCRFQSRIELKQLTESYICLVSIHVHNIIEGKVFVQPYIDTILTLC